MRRGYVKVWRSLEDSGIIGNAEVCRLFLYLMLKASSRSRKQAVGTGIVSLEPGQLVTGRKQLALAVGSTEQKIRTALSILEKQEIISQQTTNRYTLISLVNWDKYQHRQPADDQLINQRPTGGRQPDNQQPTDKTPVSKQRQEVEKLRIQHPMNTSLALAKSARVEQGRCRQGGGFAMPENSGGESRESSGRDLRPASSGPPPSRPVPYRPSSLGASSFGPDGAGDAVPSGAGHDPGLEWRELREFYDRSARPEGPMTGFAEFKQAKAARLWPGTARFCAAVADLAANDCEWLRGRRPGLKRFISERMWEMRPRAEVAGKPTGRPIEAPAGTPEQAEREKREQQRILDTLFAPPHKKKQATTAIWEKP